MTINYRETFNLFAVSGILFNHKSPLRGIDFVTKKITHSLASIKNGSRDTLKLGNINAKSDWGYAKEYVEGMWLVLQHSIPDDYVLSTGISTAVREFAEYSAKFSGFDLIWDGHGLDEKGIIKNTGQIIIEIDPKLKTLLK